MTLCLKALVEFTTRTYSEDSDLHAHLHSQIRVLVFRLKKRLTLDYPFGCTIFRKRQAVEQIADKIAYHHDFNETA